VVPALSGACAPLVDRGVVVLPHREGRHGVIRASLRVIRASLQGRDFGSARFTTSSPAGKSLLLRERMDRCASLEAAIQSALAYLHQPFPDRERAVTVLAAAVGNGRGL